MNNTIIKFRSTDDFAGLIDRVAGASGMTRSAFIRYATLAAVLDTAPKTSVTCVLSLDARPRAELRVG